MLRFRSCAISACFLIPEMKYLSVERPRSELLAVSSIISAFPSMKKCASEAEELVPSRAIVSLSYIAFIKQSDHS